MKTKFTFSIRLTSCDATTMAPTGEPLVTAQFIAKCDAHACWCASKDVPSPNPRVVRVWEMLEGRKVIEKSVVEPSAAWGEVVVNA